jgi:spore coat protein CotH
MKIVHECYERIHTACIADMWKTDLQAEGFDLEGIEVRIKGRFVIVEIKKPIEYRIDTVKLFSCLTKFDNY